MLRLVPVLIATGCVIPLGMPPARTEVGYGHTREGADTRFAIGASVGSLVKNQDSPFELGGGLLVDRGTTTYDADGSSKQKTGIGGYVDAGWAVHRTAHTRIVAGARYEGFANGPIAQAINLRVDAEILGHTESNFSDSDGCTTSSGGTYGNGGLGAFVEAGPAWSADEMSTLGYTATVGVSVRIPAWGAVVIGFCPHNGGGGGGHGFSGSGSSGSSGGHGLSGG